MRRDIVLSLVGLEETSFVEAWSSDDWTKLSSSQLVQAKRFEELLKEMERYDDK